MFVFFGISLNAQILDLPLKTEIGIAGNFCELRGSHFHTGIDFRTHGVENLPIYTAAEGYLTRIVISSSGYGKALYISHPKLGLTTLYAHLNSFSPNIEALISRILNERKINSIDTVFSKPILWIKRGEEIALSGNTGNSFAPHLHFEVRNTVTDVAYNPESFFKQIVDKISPLLPKLYLFNIEKPSPTFIKEIEIVENENLISIDTKNIAVGISAKDYYTDKNNVMGIYSAKLYEGSNTLFQIQFDSILFSNTNQVKTVSEYSYTNIKDCYKLFNEKCSNNMFMNSNNGYLFFKPNETKNLKIETSDFKGNKSYIQFKIHYTPINNDTQIELDTNIVYLACDYDNVLQSQFYKIEISQNSFPYDLEWKHQLKMKTDSTPYLNLFEENTPCLKPYNIAFNRDYFCKECNWEKYIAVLNAKTNKKTLPLFWTDSTFVIKGIKSFGTIEFIKDTSPPIISSFIKKNYKIECKIKDLESGIKSYHGYINSKWHRLYYDEKNDVIFFEGLKNDNQKKNNILLEIEDKVGNKKMVKTELFF